MHLCHSRGGIPKTDRLASETRRRSLRHQERDTISGNTGNTEGWLNLARHCLDTSNYLFAASLELRKHHASDRTCISSKSNLWDRPIDCKSRRRPTQDMGKHIVNEIIVENTMKILNCVGSRIRSTGNNMTGN